MTINNQLNESPISINIDIFRTFLAQWVIIAHLGPALFSIPLIPGRLAVWCFFIISGYLNAKSFQHKLYTGYLLAIKGYYLSRIKRIYPLLLVSCTVVAITLGTFYIKDWYVLFPHKYSYHGELSNSVLWTLIIEIQLYLLTPLLFIVAFKFRELHWLLKFIIALGLVFSIPLLNIYLSGNRDMIDDRTVAGNVGFYLFGMMLFLGENNRAELSDKLYQLLCMLLILIGMYSFVRYNFVSQGVQFTTGQLIALLTSFLLVVSVKPIFRSGHSIFKLFGFYTYEIYVLHGLMVFIYHKVNATGTLAIILFWWLLPIFLVIIFDVIYKKKYKLVFRIKFDI